MGNIVVVVLVLATLYFIVVMLRRHGEGIVPKRGTGVAADLGALADARRVRLRSVTEAGPDLPGRVRVVLTPLGGPGPAGSADLDFVVWLAGDEFGLGLLHDWQRSERPLALVIPPASRLVRLRSINDLQHLTLRLADQA